MDDLSEQIKKSIGGHIKKTINENIDTLIKRRIETLLRSNTFYELYEKNIAEFLNYSNNIEKKIESSIGEYLNENMENLFLSHLETKLKVSVRDIHYLVRYLKYGKSKGFSINEMINGKQFEQLKKTLSD